MGVRVMISPWDSSKVMLPLSACVHVPEYQLSSSVIFHVSPSKLMELSSPSMAETL